MTEILPPAISAQQTAVEAISQLNMGIVKSVGDESLAIISRMSRVRPEQSYVGNILRRTCLAVGGEACKAVCDRRADLGDARTNFDKQCSDANLAEAFEALGIDASEVIMIGVTGNLVGFGDKLAGYDDAGKLKLNPEGWQELPGFNAFFARPKEVPAIGSRLADCAHLEFEFQDRDGQTVIGFEHATRPNMNGESKFAFEESGQPVSYTHHVMARAIAHYDVDPATFKMRLSSSIRPEHFVKRFNTEAQMEAHIPGWQAAGFARNVTNPDWQPGIPTVSAEGEPDVWHADARGMILRDIASAMTALGVPAENFASDDMLDPADTAGEYSSHENQWLGDTRDLYMVVHSSARRN